MKRSHKPYLTDIIDAIEGIQETLVGVTFAEFERTWHLRRATERGLEIISEASRQLPKEMKDAEPNVPWQKIAGIGNILRHDYDEIDPMIIWNIVGESLPFLREAVGRLRAR
jgi:uncharacterized protein with HEPN domain